MLYDTISEFYDNIFPVTDGERDFLLSTAKSYGIDRILDIGCGTGGHSWELAKNGFEVIGIDAAPAMVSKAIQKAAAFSDICKSPVFAVGDMRQLPVDDKWAGMVVCIGNTLAHLASDDYVLKTFDEFKRVLKPQGVVVIQVVNYDRVLAQGKIDLPVIEVPSTKQVFYRSYESMGGDTGKVLFRSKLRSGVSGRDTDEESLIPMLPLTYEHLGSLAARSGLVNRCTYGSFTGSVFTPDSPSLIMELVKR